ncbi:MAG: VOC family protein [Bacteroidia bacterium]|nr:VOC family protein [Bacteroidia bacterium]MCC7533679.1 VOC family protein [Bacteroidia bacterium]
MKIAKTHIILFVQDQQISKDFYQTVLATEPTLHVEGMTEFNIGNKIVIGLMPKNGIAKIISPERVFSDKIISTCELYLYVENVTDEYNRILKLNINCISKLQHRDWGDTAFYFSDPDGHIIAIAQKIKPIDC